MSRERFYFCKLASRDSRFRQYKGDLQNFLEYLTYVSKTRFELHKLNEQLQHEYMTLDYHCRYSERYFKQIYARLMNFNQKYINSQTQDIHFYLLTLTLPQKNRTIFQNLQELQSKRKVIFQYLRDLRKKLNETNSIEWIWFVEPHKSGFPHCHIMILTKSKQFYEEKRKLKQLWKKETYASYSHGLDLLYVGVVHPVPVCPDADADAVADVVADADAAVTVTDADATVTDADAVGTAADGGAVVVENLVQYIIKYLSKTLLSSVDLPSLVFHSQVYKFYRPNPRWRDVERTAAGGYRVTSTGRGALRLWGYSAGLSPYLAVTRGAGREGVNVLSFGSSGDNARVFYQTENDDLLYAILSRKAIANCNRIEDLRKTLDNSISCRQN